MMNRLVLVISFFSLLVLSLGVSHADIYQCKGKDGVINFTSVPCGQKTQGIKQAPKKKAEFNSDGTKKTHQQLTAERIKKEKEFLEAVRRQKADEKKKQTKLDAHESKLRQNCENSKKKVLAYQRTNLIYKKDEKGKQTYLSDKERVEAEKRAQREVSYWCRQ